MYFHICKALFYCPHEEIILSSLTWDLQLNLEQQSRKPSSMCRRWALLVPLITESQISSSGVSTFVSLCLSQSWLYHRLYCKALNYSVHAQIERKREGEGGETLSLTAASISLLFHLTAHPFSVYQNKPCPPSSSLLSRGWSLIPLFALQLHYWAEVLSLLSSSRLSSPAQRCWSIR